MEIVIDRVAIVEQLEAVRRAAYAKNTDALIKHLDAAIAIMDAGRHLDDVISDHERELDEKRDL